MKTHRITFRAVDRDNFVDIRDGIKTIETRAATPKYQAYRPGDTLEFICGDASFVKRIAAMEHYDSLDAMFDELPLDKILPSVVTRKEAHAVYSGFPDYQEKLSAYGVLAFILEAI